MTAAPDVVWYGLDASVSGTGCTDVDGEWSSDGGLLARVRVVRYRVVTETPKGVWLQLPHHRTAKFWVSKTARKRRAYPTLEEARTSFLRRKELQHWHLTRRVKTAEMWLQLARQVTDRSVDLTGWPNVDRRPPRESPTEELADALR